MPDITMCKDEECPSKEQCYRYRATPTPEHQSYFTKSPRDSLGLCDGYFIPINDWTEPIPPTEDVNA